MSSEENLSFVILHAHKTLTQGRQTLLFTNWALLVLELVVWATYDYEFYFSK